MSALATSLISQNKVESCLTVKSRHGANSGPRWPLGLDVFWNWRLGRGKRAEFAFFKSPPGGHFCRE